MSDDGKMQSLGDATRDFFILGRECKLPDGTSGVFLRWGKGKFPCAWVYRGTHMKPTSGTFTVPKETLVDKNIGGMFSQ